MVVGGLPGGGAAAEGARSGPRGTWGDERELTKYGEIGNDKECVCTLYTGYEAGRVLRLLLVDLEEGQLGNIVYSLLYLMTVFS